MLEGVPAKLDGGSFQWQDLTGAVDVAFRAIPLRGDLLKHPAFLRLDFYERPGALHDFLGPADSGKREHLLFQLPSIRRAHRTRVDRVGFPVAV